MALLKTSTASVRKRPTALSPSIKCPPIGCQLAESLSRPRPTAASTLPRGTEAQIRTISAWGQKKQADLVRLRVGIVGAGSVGAFIAEGMARTGVEDVTVIEFDGIETKNLDRLLYAKPGNVGTLKAETPAEHLRECATAARFEALPVVAAVYEDAGFLAALDCDVLFSCVDRPWGRHVLNLIAYAHLIPVIDGGISVRANKHDELAAADWRAHTVTVGHQCMQCMGQYDPGLVQLERDGYLDDPTYILGLAKNHPLRVRENVFAFSMACASLQTLQMLAMVLDPLGRSNPGEQLYHFVGGFMEPSQHGKCDQECLFPDIVAKGDHCGFEVTGPPPSTRAPVVVKRPEPEPSILRRFLNGLQRFVALRLKSTAIS
jgi:molybdopterin-synthase adenylyltransferase